MQCRFTRIFPLSNLYNGINTPSLLKITAKNLKAEAETLSVYFPLNLPPSDVGLQRLVATSIMPEELLSELDTNPQQSPPIRLFIVESLSEEEEVTCWYADARSVFSVIWREVEQVCKEQNLEIDKVELQ